MTTCEFPLPTPVVEVLTSEPGQRSPRSIGDFQSGIEPDRATRVPDPLVQLVVLIAVEMLVIASQALQGRLQENAQINGVGPARLAADPVPGVACSEPGGHGGGDRFLPCRPTHRHLHAADHIGPGIDQGLHGPSQIAGRDHRMGIHPGDHLSRGAGQGEIEPCWCSAARVVHHYRATGAGCIGGSGVGSRHHHRSDEGIRLTSDRFQCGPDRLADVLGRHDHVDRGLSHHAWILTCFPFGPRKHCPCCAPRPGRGTRP